MIDEDEPNWKRVRYEYDAYGNRIRMTVEGRTSGETFAVTTYQYDRNNRLEQEVKKEGKTTETYQYQYDNNGNETFRIWERIALAPAGPGEVCLSGKKRSHPTVYEWRQYNGFHQLIRIFQDEGEIAYQYHGDGMRHSKEVELLTVPQAKKTLFYWDGTDIVGEQTDGKGVISYLRGLNLIASQREGMLYHYLFNQHGDVVQVRDQNGSRVRSYQYDVFGEEKDLWEENENPFRYCGEYYDSSNETYYLRARDYRASIGRFISEDPIRAGLNWYCYYENNPVNRIDPWGLDSYLYYDPDTLNFTGNYIPIWQQNLADQFHRGDINKVKLISVAPTSYETSTQIFSREWSEMSNDASIQSVVFHGHGSKEFQHIKLFSDFRVTASDDKIGKIKSAFGGEVLNINHLDKITAEYFLLSSCNQGLSTLDYTGSNKGVSNFASDIVLGKHTIRKSVIAIDGQGIHYRNEIKRVSSDGNGYRSFMWNDNNKTVDSFYLGGDFNSLSSLIKAQIIGSANPSLYQTPLNIPPLSKKKKKA